MSESRGKDDQSDIVTVPPPPGGDAYNAKTVVAPAPEEVLELLRAAQERAGIPPVPHAVAADAGNDEASKPIVPEPVVTGGENLPVVGAPRPPAVDPTPAPIAPSPPGPEAPVAPLPARVDPMPPPIHAAESPPQRELGGAALVIIAVFVIGVALMLGIVWAIVRQR